MQTEFFDGMISQHYQPIVDLKSMKIAACEALMRPATGRPADKLAQELENTGLIKNLDLWSLKRAIATNQALTTPFLISVNLSGMSISDERFCMHALDLLRQMDRSNKVGFEITESAPITCMTTAARFVAEARSLGCSVGLDDLHTGHASMATVEALGLDFIKLPAEITTARSSVSEEIISKACHFAEKRGIQVVAEHIDNVAQLVWLKSLGVGYGQGWLFAKAAPIITPGANFSHVLAQQEASEEFMHEAAICVG